MVCSSRLPADTSSRGVAGRLAPAAAPSPADALLRPRAPADGPSCAGPRLAAEAAPVRARALAADARRACGPSGCRKGSWPERWHTGRFCPGWCAWQRGTAEWGALSGGRLCACVGTAKQRGIGARRVVPNACAAVERATLRYTRDLGLRGETGHAAA
eukprot:5131163-Prymnesium_polylepis.1